MLQFAPDAAHGQNQFRVHLLMDLFETLHLDRAYIQPHNAQNLGRFLRQLDKGGVIPAPAGIVAQMTLGMGDERPVPFLVLPVVAGIIAGQGRPAMGQMGILALEQGKALPFAGRAAKGRPQGHEAAGAAIPPVLVCHIQDGRHGPGSEMRGLVDPVAERLVTPPHLLEFLLVRAHQDQMAPGRGLSGFYQPAIFGT